MFVVNRTACIKIENGYRAGYEDERPGTAEARNSDRIETGDLVSPLDSGHGVRGAFR